MFVDANILTMDWDFVSQYKTLTENQMSKYARFLNWTKVCEHQYISFQFAREMIQHLDLSVLGNHQPHLSIADMFRLSCLQ